MLLELIAVIVIIAILSSLSVIGFRRSRQTSLIDSESRKIRNAFSTARSWAIGQSGYFQVVISLDDSSYWIDQINAAGTVTRAKVITPEAIHDLVEITDLSIGSVSYTSGVQYVRFYPNGRSNEVTVHLILAAADHSDAAQYYTIRLYGPTARANIFKNQRR